MSQLSAPLPQGLASLLSNRRRRNQVLQARGLPPRRQTSQTRGAVPVSRWPGAIEPPGGQTGGLLGYRNGGRTMNPRAAAAAARRMHTLRKLKSMGGRAPYPMGQNPYESPIVAGTGGTGPPGGKHGGHVKGYQMGGTAGRRGGPPLPPRPPGWVPPARSAPTGPYDPFLNIPSGRGPGGWQEGGPVGAAPEEVEMASEIYARATPEQQAQITGGGGGPGMMDEEAAIGEALAMAMGGGGGPPMNGAPPMGGLI